MRLGGVSSVENSGRDGEDGNALLQTGFHLAEIHQVARLSEGDAAQCSDRVRRVVFV